MLAAANFKFTVNEGVVYGYFSATGLQALELHDGNVSAPLLLRSTPNPAWEQQLHQSLEQYFSGAVVSFSDIPLDFRVGTPFQKRVWRNTASIPYGESVSYGELAQRLNRPGAARAVGTALGENPVCIVVPCHRVLAAGNGLGGFSAGLHWKRRLLTLEGISFTE